MKFRWIFCLCLLVIAPINHAQENKKIVILNGVPSVRVTSTAKETKREELTDRQKHEFRILVTKVGDDYIWETRYKKPLIKTRSGVYVYFTSPRGGYIKIATKDSPADEPLTYMEHLNAGLLTVTYWGTLEDFHDDDAVNLRGCLKRFDKRVVLG